jgi:hypothetical protein
MHQPFWLREREWAKKHGVYDREDSCIGADAKTQGGDSDRCEPWIATEPPKPVAKVTPKIVK